MKDGMPKKKAPPSRSTIWKRENRARYNAYQRKYMRELRRRAREKAEGRPIPDGPISFKKVVVPAEALEGLQSDG